MRVRIPGRVAAGATANLLRAKMPEAAGGRSKASALLAALLLLLGLMGCSARRGEHLKGPLDLTDPRVARGETVFMAKCNKCHPGGEAGLGPSLNNRPLPEFFVRYQARSGTGAMPPFDADELPDKDLADVTAYLKALRINGAEPESGQGAGHEGTAQAETGEGEKQAADVR